MKTLRLFCVLACLFALPQVVRAQYFEDSSPNPLTAPSTGNAVAENGQATVHALKWDTAGSPKTCFIQITSDTDSDGSFGGAIGQQKLDCTKSGSYTIKGVTAAYVEVRLSDFKGVQGDSVSYKYVGIGPAAELWTFLDALRAVEAYRHGITSIDSCQGSVPGQTPDLTDADFQLYDETFGASLDVAASFGDTGSNGIPSATNSIQTEPLGQLQFESEHFFYDWAQCVSHKPTLSFGGTVGLRPALVLENLTSTGTITNSSLRPMFQDAFGWSLGPKFNLATSRSQFSMFATLGGNYLVSQVTSFKQGDDTVTATPISNSVGQSALFGETGIEWKLLNTNIVNAYINKTDALNPPFDVSVGFRDDARFRRAGDLPKTYADPQGFVFFRFEVGLNKISNYTGTQVNPGKGYTFKFGVDYEKPAHESRMPTATRYYVSANIDLMQLFKPSQQPSTGSPSTQNPSQGQQQPQPQLAARATIQLK